MNQSRILPFYMAYPLPMYYQQEDSVTRDLEYLQQMYPAQAKKFQKLIAETLDHIDYEGSMIYDEYPDRYCLQALAGSMLKALEKEEEDPPTQDIVQVLLLTEIYKRRHGGRRGKIF